MGGVSCDSRGLLLGKEGACDAKGFCNAEGSLAMGGVSCIAGEGSCNVGGSCNAEGLLQCA